VRHRVIVVRGPRSAGGGGGGCCSGDVRPFDEGGSHEHAGRAADDVAEVYRALLAVLPADVDVQLVSPSNWLWLLPALVTDGRRRGLRGAELRHSVRAGITVSSLVVDGVVVARGRLPDPTAAVAAVDAELARAGSR
jgi:hypothetical protein